MLFGYGCVDGAEARIVNDIRRNVLHRIRFAVFIKEYALSCRRVHAGERDAIEDDRRLPYLRRGRREADYDRRLARLRTVQADVRCYLADLPGNHARGLIK